MRLWLKDSERRPDPAPVKTDDRKVVLVGLVLWLLALGGLLLFLAPLLASDRSWWLWTVLIGFGIGLVLLVYVHRRRHS
jgi:cyanate permease